RPAAPLNGFQRRSNTVLFFNQLDGLMAAKSSSSAKGETDAPKRRRTRRAESTPVDPEVTERPELEERRVDRREKFESDEPRFEETRFEESVADVDHAELE